MIPEAPRSPSLPRLARLPFFYGWVVVAVAFVTMAIGVNTRTAFSLLFPPILAEFGWDRATIAAAFSLGFVASAFYTPFIGTPMDRFGPRLVIPFGVLLVCAGLILATHAAQPWQFHLSLGVLVVGGSVFISYVGHSLILPHWFVRRRGLATGIAFSGVGVGAIVLSALAAEPDRRERLARRLLGARRPAAGGGAAAQPRPAAPAPGGSGAGARWRPGRRGRRGRARRRRQRRRPPLGGDRMDARAGGPRGCASGGCSPPSSAACSSGMAVLVHQTKYLIEIGFSPDARGLGARPGRASPASPGRS